VNDEAEVSEVVEIEAETMVDLEDDETIIEAEISDEIKVHVKCIKQRALNAVTNAKYLSNHQETDQSTVESVLTSTESFRVSLSLFSFFISK
jgi:hypothetical protein